MSVNKIQFVKPTVITEKTRHVLKRRNIPNSVSLPNEVFQKGGGASINFYESDLLKMAKMSFEECKKYKEFLITSGKFYKISEEKVVEELPEWIQQAIKSSQL